MLLLFALKQSLILLKFSQVPKYKHTQIEQPKQVQKYTDRTNKSRSNIHEQNKQSQYKHTQTEQTEQVKHTQK